MATIDEVYDKVSEVSGDVKALRLHVLGNGGPGLAERLRQLEVNAAERMPIVTDIHQKTKDIDARLKDIEIFENKEHGAFKFIGICIPVVLGLGGLTVSIIKLSAGG